MPPTAGIRLYRRKNNLDAQTLLYLFTMEEGHYWFTAIDADTMNVKARMKIAHLDPDDSYGPRVYDCGDFICMDMESVKKIAVISVSPYEKFTVEMIADTTVNGEHCIPAIPHPVFAFDGERLAVGMSGLQDAEKANYDLLVITSDGPQYWAPSKPVSPQAKERWPAIIMMCGRLNMIR